MMNSKELAEKVELLKAGQIVEIDGLSFSAKRIHPAFQVNPCNECNVDSLCQGDVAEVCTMLDFMSKSVWYLKLES